MELLLALPAALLAGLATSTAQADEPPQGEPTNATEAALQEKYGDKISLDDYIAYRQIVEALPDEEKAWEVVLEDQLGSFYFPLHLARRIRADFVPETSEWGFIRDDPALPRVILIGDSISRSYTVPVRQALAGKANVHRAPANCGPTDSGLRNLDVWLNQGSGKWDLIYLNFGIHDRAKSPEQYGANLEQVVARLEATGARLIFARTTPFRTAEAPDVDGSLALNAVSDAVMQRHGIAVDGLHAAVAASLDTVQADDHTHFKVEGIQLLAAQAAQTIAAVLAEP